MQKKINEIKRISDKLNFHLVNEKSSYSTCLQCLKAKFKCKLVKFENTLRLTKKKRKLFF